MKFCGLGMLTMGIKVRWWNGQRMIEHRDINCLVKNIDNLENVMLYSGLFDADNKEVCEGDLVYFSFGIPPTAVKAEVKLQHGCFCVLTPDLNPEWCLLGNLETYVGEFFVIGNIHEGVTGKL